MTAITFIKYFKHVLLMKFVIIWIYILSFLFQIIFLLNISEHDVESNKKDDGFQSSVTVEVKT